MGEALYEGTIDVKRAEILDTSKEPQPIEETSKDELMKEYPQGDNYKILPKIKDAQETTLFMSVTYKDSTEKSEPIIYTKSKSRTIDALKKSFPFPNTFWMELKKENVAEIDQDGKIIKFWFEEAA